MLTPPTLRARILQIFNQSCRGGTSLTNAFEVLPESVRSALAPFLREPGELAIVASYISTDSWVLVTTSNLVYSDSGEHTAIPWSEVESCIASDFAERRIDVSSKEDSTRFTVTTRNRRQHTFQTEPGSPFIAIWNVLNAMARS